MIRTATSNKIRLAAILVALTVVAVFAMTGSAFATGKTVTANVYCSGVNLKGSSETSVAAFIRSHVGARVPRLPVVAAGKGFSFDPKGSLSVDVTAMVATAVDATSDTTLTPRAKADWNKIRVWVGTVATKANRSPVNAHYYVTKRRLLGVAKQVDGAQIYVKDATNLIAKTIVWEAETGGRPRRGVNLPFKAIGCKITTKQGLGKAILVRRAKTHLWLYSGSKVQFSVDCAVGQPRYPTPLGTWKIIDKNPAPSWNNPGSAWAVNMPSHIPPGPSNPLGLRALYLNADGIRIHGTSNIGSIGTPASHGCIRVANGQIVKLYPLVPIGTTVYIID